MFHLHKTLVLRTLLCNDVQTRIASNSHTERGRVMFLGYLKNVSCATGQDLLMEKLRKIHELLLKKR